jgi:intracellular multiplication protein IcmD
MYKNSSKFIGYLILLASCFTTSCVWAAGGNNSFIEFSNNMHETITQIIRLATAIAYIGGVCFSIIGLLKFKAYKDNPAQIPLGTPILLIAVSAGLLFLPTVFDIAKSAVFGEKAKPGISQEIKY